MQESGEQWPSRGMARLGRIAALLLVVSVIATACTSSSDSPAQIPDSGDSGAKAVPPTTAAMQESIETSVDISLRPGEATTLRLDIDELADLEPTSTESSGVAVEVAGEQLIVTAATFAKTGEVSFDVSTVGCVRDTCGIDVSIDVIVAVVPYPADAAAATPLMTPEPSRIAETETPGVYRAIDEFVVLADATFDPVTAATELDIRFIGGIPKARTWQFAVDAERRMEAEAALAAYPGTEKVIPHLLGKIDLSDARYPGDWDDDGKAATWHFDLIDAPTLWFDARWAPDVKVGIIDAGVWPDHEDLNVGERHSYCEGDGCESGLGHEDHGTHVGALACADDQGVGLVGTAWGCELHAVDIYQAPSGYFENAVLSAILIQDAMIRVVDMGVDIVNMSLGYPVLGEKGECHDAGDAELLIASQVGHLLAKAIDYGTDQRAAQGRPDVVWVVAAGNDCLDANYKAPARLSAVRDNVITVASVDSDGQLSAFSNWGSAVTIASPGGFYWDAEGDPTEVWSAGTDCSDEACRSSYKSYPGTSMAAPIVTGLAALIRHDAPDLSAGDLARCLAAGATPVTDWHPEPGFVTSRQPELAGIGLVNAPAAYACAVNPEPLSAEEIADKIGCHGECQVTGTVPLDHPSWGSSTLATYRTEPSSADTWPTGIVVFDATGVEKWHLDMTDDQLYDLYPAGKDHSGPWMPPLYEDAVVRASTDVLGHIFVVWNPGRYDGIMALRPTVDGFELFDAAYYPADIGDVDGDGQFEILDINDCDVGCRTSASHGSLSSLPYGSTLAEALYWNGSDYAPRWDAQYTFPISSDKYKGLFGAEVSGEPHWSGCSPGTPDTLPDGVWYGYVTGWNHDGVEFDLACDLGWGWDDDCGCDYPNISNTNSAIRFLRWSDNFQAYAWRKDDQRGELTGPWTVDELLIGDAELLGPVDDPDWPTAPAPPVLLYVNDGVVTELEATFRS